MSTGSPPPRILVLSSLFPRKDHPVSGVFVREQVAALRRYGIEARVLTGVENWLGPSRPGAAMAAVGDFLSGRLSWEDDGGVPFARFPTLVVGRLGGAERSRAYERGLRRVLGEVRRSFPFDLVHAHTALLDGAAAAKLKPALGVPVVLTEHTGPFSAILGTSGMRRRVYRALDHADVLIAVSAAHAAAMRTAFPELRRDIEVLPNGVDTSLFQPRQEPRQGTRKVVAWIGHFDEVKRPDLALAAFAPVAARLPDAVLHLVGGGPLEAALRRQVEKAGLSAQVRFEPYLARDELARRLAAADALLVTSTVETFGVVVIEALASGVPVVATRCGGPEEILRADDALGRLAADNPASLAAALLAVLDSPADSGYLRDHAMHHFGLDTVAARLAAIYRRLLAPSGSPCAA